MITSAVEVLEYTEVTAACHARLIAHAGRAGVPRGAHDLIIAAHALQTERIVLTVDAKARFGDLPWSPGAIRRCRSTRCHGAC